MLQRRGIRLLDPEFARGSSWTQVESVNRLLREARPDGVIMILAGGLWTRAPFERLQKAGMKVETIDLRVNVPSTDQGRVKVGDALKVKFPATGVEIDARVARVVPSVDPRTRTFPVIAEIPNPGMALRPGMFAEVRFGKE